MSDRCGAVGGPSVCGRELGHEGSHIPGDSWEDAPPPALLRLSILVAGMARWIAMMTSESYPNDIATAIRANAEAERLLAEYRALVGLP